MHYADIPIRPHLACNMNGVFPSITRNDQNARHLGWASHYWPLFQRPQTSPGFPTTILPAILPSLTHRNYSLSLYLRPCNHISFTTINAINVEENVESLPRGLNKPRLKENEKLHYSKLLNGLHLHLIYGDAFYE